MRLDTIRGEMTAAEGLYRSLGFEESEPYYDSPIPGVIYYALRLRSQAARTGWLPP